MHLTNWLVSSADYFWHFKLFKKTRKKEHLKILHPSLNFYFTCTETCTCAHKKAHTPHNKNLRPCPRSYLIEREIWDTERKLPALLILLWRLTMAHKGMRQFSYSPPTKWVQSSCYAHNKENGERWKTWIMLLIWTGFTKSIKRL